MLVRVVLVRVVLVPGVLAPSVLAPSVLAPSVVVLGVVVLGVVVLGVVVPGVVVPGVAVPRIVVPVALFRVVAAQAVLAQAVLAPNARVPFAPTLFVAFLVPIELLARYAPALAVPVGVALARFCLAPVCQIQFVDARGSKRLASSSCRLWQPNYRALVRALAAGSSKRYRARMRSMLGIINRRHDLSVQPGTVQC